MVPPLRQGDGVFPPLSQRVRVRVGAKSPYASCRRFRRSTVRGELPGAWLRLGVVDRGVVQTVNVLLFRRDH